MLGLEKIYTPEVIKRSQDETNRTSIPNANRFAERSNEQCGDKIAVQIFKRNDGVIAGAAFSGKGCILSQASASMMIDLIRGKTVDEARNIVGKFMLMMGGAKIDEETEKELGDVVNFHDVCTALKSRTPCVTLAWQTLMDALENETEE